MQDRKDLNLELTSEDKQVLLQHFPHGICAFDFEMTGLSPVFDKIIEIAAVRLLPSKEIETFHRLINPLVTISEQNSTYHGLTNEDLRQAPSLRTPLQEFCGFYQDLPLLAHNAQFDASFLIRGLHEFNYSVSRSDVIDSCRYVRMHFKKRPNPPENFRLGTLAEFFKLDFQHHQALDDAMVCLKILALCLSDDPKLKPQEAKVFKLQDFKKQEAYILPKRLHALKTVLPSKTPIKIKYSGGQTKSEFRPIVPVAVLPLPQGLVLYGECLIDNIYKYFKIKKIREIDCD